MIFKSRSFAIMPNSSLPITQILKDPSAAVTPEAMTAPLQTTLILAPAAGEAKMPLARPPSGEQQTLPLTTIWVTFSPSIVRALASGGGAEDSNASKVKARVRMGFRMPAMCWME